ncbi:MAG: hypothetical protein ACE5JM_02720 [Armatimonadota bacterium]
MAKACPWCGRANPPSASRCDCGHLFMSDALLQWVRDSQSAGRSQKQITQELLRAGHALEDVQVVLGEAAGLTDRRERSSTGVGIAVGIIGVVIGSVVMLLIVVVLLLILAWYLIYGKRPAPPPTQIQEQIEELDRPQEEESEDEQIEEPGSSPSPSRSPAPEGPTKGAWGYRRLPVAPEPGRAVCGESPRGICAVPPPLTRGGNRDILPLLSGTYWAGRHTRGSAPLRRRLMLTDESILPSRS